DRAGALGPVFLDREELSSSADLATTVRTALEQSAALIVVCSPAAARSRWVNEEIRSFKALGREQHILCLVVAGDPGAAVPGDDCFPAALRYRVVDGQITNLPEPEPLAADVRPGADHRRDASLKLIAALLGVSLDDLRQREQARRQRRLAIIAGAATLGCIVLSALAATALLARIEADRQRALAEQKSLTAERTAGFMVSLFAVSDPSEARGNSITAREILDRGARQIDAGLAGEPVVRAELATTLGQVYYGLGLYPEASNLLQKGRSAEVHDPRLLGRQAIALADVAAAQGDYTGAEPLYVEADRQSAMAEPVDVETQARALVGRGDTASKQERFGDAERLFNSALVLAREPRAPPDLAARALEGIALAKLYAGDTAAAVDWYARALVERTRVSGNDHPNVGQILANMGAAEYLRGDTAQAERYMLRAVDVDRRVLGPQHPDVAISMNTLGRLRLEQRRFADARQMLGDSVAILERQLPKAHEDLTLPLSNLALAAMGQGDYLAAEPLLARSLQAAEANGQDGNRGMVQSYLADLLCRTERPLPGLERVAAARALVQAEYADEPWRGALLDDVEGGCLTQLGRYAEAQVLVGRSVPVLLARWPASSLYGHDALERSRRLYQRTGDSARLADITRLVSP
ncbi:MAG: toll/interleukin-1 receptor domain-containing protein, partial [Gammaproteobacteria bacterium]